MLDSLARVASWQRVVHVRIDTARGGITSIHFDPTSVPVAVRARSPESAVAAFLARYGSPVLGLNNEHDQLELLRANTHGDLKHFRYVQFHSGHRVLHGELIVHVARLPGGFAVQSANGWLFPEIGEDLAPALTRHEAEQVAIVGLTQARARSSPDAPPVVVAHEGTYRLAFLVSVLDEARGVSAARYVDAITGSVFAESPDADTESPMVRRSGATRVRRSARPAGSVSASRERAAERFGSAAAYEQANGLDWFGASRDFKVFFTGAVYQLRDNEHPGAAEIRIHDYSGDSLSSNPCDVESIVQRANNDPWPSSDGGDEEVSAVHNLGVVVSYFKNSFGRNGMMNDNDTLKACVHGASSGWQSYYSRPDTSLSFRQETGSDGPTVAGQEVATHEFTHGVLHKDVNFSLTFDPQSVNEALADYFGARTRLNERCRGKDVYLGHTHLCVRYLSLDSLAECEARNTQSLDPHCQGIRLASALLNATESSSGSFAGKVDSVVYYTIDSYLTSGMDMIDAAYWTIYFALQIGHQGTNPPWTSLYSASPTLENALLSAGLHWRPPVAVQMAMPSGWVVTINPTFYIYDITFEIGTQGLGLNHDGSVVWPDSQIPLGEHYYEGPITFGQDVLDWHACSDGHAHGFRVTSNHEYGPLTYYAGMTGCGGSLVAGPATPAALPTHFAVRQAVQPPGGSPALSGGAAPQTLSAQIRQYGLTALDVDVPDGVASAPIVVTVYNPQGRIVRRFTTDRVGPGTQRVPWDRKDDGGRDAPPGVYVVLVQHGSNRHRTHFVIPAER